MVPSVAPRYRILQEVGRGGMGIVYKAEDLKLHRIVALKFLPEELSASEDDIARFQREAEAISSLNHPNIATIYDIDEVEGRKFLTLEFIPGGTLKSKVKQLVSEGRQMPIGEVVGYGIQMAEGLGHAHKHGIVHRDIKTDNIMLGESGQLKITDFGLAKLRGPSQLTRAGSTVGTLAYMAPEQIQGENVDARADIFSLGVVFFELLTGRLPFQGEHDAAILYSLLNESPLSIRTFRPDVPASILNITGKMLQKSPHDRYQSATELLSDLRNSSQVGFATSPEHKSIVVLPFENMSPDKENEYFSDGLTEEIISDLSAIRSLRVISRTSAMRLKGSTKDIKTIAEELDVRYVLEGSVRKAGQNLRITAQLIDGKSDANLWSEKYAGTLEDVFEIQGNVSRAIVGALKVKLSSDEERRIEERPIRNAQAHDLYLRARKELNRGVPEALLKSIELLNEGLALVGENELLYAALGHTYYSYFRWISKADESYIHRAKGYLQKTFAINPSNSQGLALQGLLQYADGNIAAAIQAMTGALAIEPTNTEALLWLNTFYTFVGRHTDAIRVVDELIAIDPLLPINTIIKGMTYIWHGEFAEGLPWVERGYAMDTQSPVSKWALAIALAWCGLPEKAIVIIDELAGQAPGWVYTHHGLFLKHALRGERDLALKYDSADLALEARHDLHFSLHVAHCYALIHEKEKAFAFLERGIRMGMYNYPFLSRLDPLLENLRTDERFKTLMQEVKLLQDKFPD